MQIYIDIMLWPYDCPVFTVNDLTLCCCMTNIGRKSKLNCLNLWRTCFCLRNTIIQSHAATKQLDNSCVTHNHTICNKNSTKQVHFLCPVLRNATKNNKRSRKHHTLSWIDSSYMIWIRNNVNSESWFSDEVSQCKKTQINVESRHFLFFCLAVHQILCFIDFGSEVRRATCGGRKVYVTEYAFIRTGVHEVTDWSSKNFV